MRLGNVYQIANGYMGYRGTLDEFGPDELVGITLAGIFDRVGDAWREPVNAPNGGFTQVTLDGVAISALSTTIQNHEQSLNLENAVFERETHYASQGKTVRIKSVRFLSADRPNLGIIKYSLKCDKDAKVTINTGIDFNIWDLNGPHLTKVCPEKNAEILVVHAITNELSKKVAVAEIVDLDFGNEAHEIQDHKNLRVIHLEAEAGKTYTFCKYFAVYTENDPIHVPVNEAAMASVREAKALGYETCLNHHNAQWAKSWERCDVQIDGDDVAQHALRYSIFQLLIVAPVTGSGNSIPARGIVRPSI